MVLPAGVGAADTVFDFAQGSLSPPLLSLGTRAYPLLLSFALVTRKSFTAKVKINSPQNQSPGVRAEVSAPQLALY
jgi:hypothetical protein